MKASHIIFLVLLVGLVVLTACTDVSIDKQQPSQDIVLTQEEMDDLFSVGAETGLTDDEDFIELGEMI